MMRLVIDSNVWISALVFGGKPRAIFEWCVQNGTTVISSQELITETRRILHAKFPDLIEDYDDVLLVLERNIQVVSLGKITISASRDEDDNRVLETAVLGQASHIISGDKDLLALKAHREATILSPADFCNLLQ